MMEYSYIELHRLNRIPIGTLEYLKPPLLNYNIGYMKSGL